MGSKFTSADLGGVWSAAPTPLDERMGLDAGSVARMVEHHLRLGIKGLFLAGTNGEGPWLPERQRRRLVDTVVRCARNRLIVAVQVTDNSTARILDNIDTAREDGADIAVIAPPYFSVLGRPAVEQLYLEAIRQSRLPIGIYDRGRAATVSISEALLRRLYLSENVVLVKDSSGDPRRRAVALSCRRIRPELRLLCGSEFDCVGYMKAGYDGLLLGGGVFNGYMAARIIEAVQQGDESQARKIQERMNRIMYAVYGGKKLTCWLSGEKRLLVEMGIFRTWNSYLGFPLTESCLRAIRNTVSRHADVLFPWRKAPA